MNRPHTRLLALQSQNKAAPRAYRIENGADEATIYLYDVIGYDWWTDGGITALQFAADLNAIRGVSTIHLRFNSPGGDVFDGRAICAALDAHPARKVGHVDGLAASAASFILMHCDEVEMVEGSMLMIHNGQTWADGDRHAFAKRIALLEKVDDSIVTDYLRRVNVDAEQLTAWMDAETWITAGEAVEHGFADRIAEGDGAKARNAWNLAAYTNAPVTVIVENAAGAELEIEESHGMVNVTIKDTADADHAHRMRLVEIAALNPA